MAVKMTEMKTTLLGLLARIAPDADLEELSLDDDIQEELEIDSFDFLNFLIAIDETYGVEIPERDYGQVRTLGAVIDYVQARLA